MDIYSRLINRENPLPENFVPEDLVSCEFPFLAAGSAQMGETEQKLAMTASLFLGRQMEQ